MYSVTESMLFDITIMLEDFTVSFPFFYDNKNKKNKKRKEKGKKLDSTSLDHSAMS